MVIRHQALLYMLKSTIICYKSLFPSKKFGYVENNAYLCSGSYRIDIK